jgi:DNA-binding NarL/FixJ family response regulator
VDDHQGVRQSLETVLGRHGCVVTASASTARDGYEAIVSRPPDVAILDINLPDELGPELARRLLERQPGLGVLIYTGTEDEGLLRHALDSGARGFALKSGGIHELREAIEAVAAGRTYVDPGLRATLLSRKTTDNVAILSRREREVLDLLSRGKTGEEAAKVLFLSPETIRVHVRNAMRKLEAHTRVHAVALAIRHGEIEIPPDAANSP